MSLHRCLWQVQATESWTVLPHPPSGSPPAGARLRAERGRKRARARVRRTPARPAARAQGAKPDYLYLLQRMCMDNPEAAVGLAKSVARQPGPPMELNTLADVFLQRNMVRPAPCAPRGWKYARCGKPAAVAWTLNKGPKVCRCAHRGGPPRHLLRLLTE